MRGKETGNYAPLHQTKQEGEAHRRAKKWKKQQEQAAEVGCVGTFGQEMNKLHEST